MNKKFLNLFANLATTLFSPFAMLGLALVLFVILWATAGAWAALTLLFIMGIALLPFNMSEAARFADVVARYTSTYRPIRMTAEQFTPEGFASMVSSLRDQINAMLAGLPPLEQFEAANDLSYGLRSIQNSAANLLELADSFTQNVTSYSEKLKKDITASVQQSAEAKLIEKGEFVKKTDAETAQGAAVTAAEEKVRADLSAAEQVKLKVVEARAKLVTDKVVASQAVADALPETFFAEEGYADRVAKLTARLKKLTDEKLTTEEFVSEMASLPLDDAGDKTFDARVKSVKSLVGASASRGGRVVTPVVGAIPPVEGDAPKRRLFF